MVDVGETELSLSVEFHGLTPSSDHLLLDGRALFSELTIASPFRRMPAEALETYAASRFDFSKGCLER